MNVELQLDRATLDRLVEAVGDETLREIVALFLSNAPQRVSAARSAAAAGNLDGAALALHSLKSSAGMLGAARLHSLADRMERLARENAGPALVALLPELEQAYERLEAELNSAKFLPGAR